MKFSLFLLIEILLMLSRLNYLIGNVVPVLNKDSTEFSNNDSIENSQPSNLPFIPLISLIDKSNDTSEFWREAEILSLVREHLDAIDQEKCKNGDNVKRDTVVRFPSLRVVRPICRGPIDPLSQQRSRRSKSQCLCYKLIPRKVTHKKCTYFRQDHFCPCKVKTRRFPTTRRRKNRINFVPDKTQVMRRTSGDIENNFYHQLCPQCSHFTNYSECELFRDSCKERRVSPDEMKTYCDRRYGKWRAMMVPADYSQCRCCDECVFYRELDQSCMYDEYAFDVEEFLPTTSIDFRAGCNPYWGHPEQEFRALRCDKNLRRCVPVSAPAVPKENIHIARYNFRYEPPTGGADCPMSCRGYTCKDDKVKEEICRPGAFLPDKNSCNCCGKCSSFQQINEKCAEFKKTVQDYNGTKEIEVEEEFLEPGCDDGLVCRQGHCQDIHNVKTTSTGRKKRDETIIDANEPCKRELKFFKKKYGPEGHLHYDAPQCTPLWLYAPVQCRRFVCYCALEDGTIIQGIKVPRVEVSNMNCDCAREKCRLNSDVECDGYGNYKEAVFTPNQENWHSTEGDVTDKPDNLVNQGTTLRGTVSIDVIN